MTGKESVRTALNQSREVLGGIPLFGGLVPRRVGWVKKASLGVDKNYAKEVIAGEDALGIKRVTTLNFGGELK